MNGNSTPYSSWPSGEPPFVPKIWNKFRVDQHNCYAYMLNDLQRRKNGKSQPGVFGKNTINTLNCAETIKGVLADNNGIVRYMTLKKGLKYVPRPNYYKGFLMVSPDMDFHFARQDNRMLAVYDAMLRHGGGGESALKKLNPDQFMKLMFVYCKAKMPEICRFLPAKTNSNYASLKAKLRFLYRNSKTWSHKPGESPVSDVDAQKRLIFDPLKADWNFPGGINYSSHCCFFEIPMNRLKATRSTGGNINANGRSDANLKPLKNVDTTSSQQVLDKRVRKILGLK